MDVLSIGNSFSQDAQRYLHSIAKSGKMQLNAFNLYIGGCSLEKHYNNMLTEKQAYLLEMNGESTGFFVSLREALLNRSWDVVTVQQVSGKSTDYDTYQPFLDKLVEFIRLCVPKAKIAIHQTWAYEQNSRLLNTVMGYGDQKDMFNDLKASYAKAEKAIGADMVIPSGELFQTMLSSGIEKIHRDTLHASNGTGRYALGLIWYAVLTGKDIADNAFAELDEEVFDEHINIAKKSVAKVCEAYGIKLN